MKFENYFVKPEVRRTDEISYHKEQAPGLRWVFMEKSLFNEADIYLMIRSMKNIPSNQPDYVEMHSHNVNSYYVFIGNYDDFTGLKAEVNIDDEKYIVDSPMTVFIPKGVKHSIKPISGSGNFINIVSNGDYEGSLKKKHV